MAETNMRLSQKGGHSRPTQGFQTNLRRNRVRRKAMSAVPPHTPSPTRTQPWKTPCHLAVTLVRPYRKTAAGQTQQDAGHLSHTNHAPGTTEGTGGKTE